MQLTKLGVLKALYGRYRAEIVPGVSIAWIRAMQPYTEDEVQEAWVAFLREPPPEYRNRMPWTDEFEEFVRGRVAQRRNQARPQLPAPTPVAAHEAIDKAALDRLADLLGDNHPLVKLERARWEDA